MRVIDSSIERQGPLDEVVAVELVGGHDGINPDGCAGHLQHEIAERGLAPVGLHPEGKAVDGETGVLAETETLHIDVQRVVGKSAEVDVAADIIESEMGGVELPFGLWLVELVVADAGMADDEGIDTDVERSMRGSVLRGEAVDEKLEVCLCLSIGLIQTETGTEELCGADGNLTLQQRYDVHLYRHTGSTDHLLLALVEDDEVIENETAGQAKVHTTDADLSA